MSSFGYGSEYDIPIREFPGGPIQWTNCQFKENIVTDSDCVNNCYPSRLRCTDSDPNNDSTSRNCCEAYGSYCRRLKGDRKYGLDPNDPTRVIIAGEFNSDHIVDKELCIELCGDASIDPSVVTPECKYNKKRYCTEPDKEWDTKRVSYCKAFWQKPENFNYADLDDVCGTQLTDPNSDENVFDINGCAKLCRGGNQDVNKPYCDDKRLAMCSRDRTAPFSNSCKSFCQDNPYLCENMLASTCQDIVEEHITALDENGKDISDPNYELTSDTYDNQVKPLLDSYLLDSEGNETDNTFGNICGCFLPSSIYKGFVDIVNKKFEDEGVTFSYDKDNIANTPECHFKACNSGIRRPGQHTDCGDCVQNMLINLENTNIDRCLIATNFNSGCVDFDQAPNTELPDFSECSKVSDPNNPWASKAVLPVVISTSVLSLIIIVGIVVLIKYLLKDTDPSYNMNEILGDRFFTL